MSFDNDLKNYKPTPHPAKAVFHKHKVPMYAVAHYLGLSYGYTCNIMSGVVKPSDEVQKRLKKVVSAIEGK